MKYPRVHHKVTVEILNKISSTEKLYHLKRGSRSEIYLTEAEFQALLELDGTHPLSVTGTNSRSLEKRLAEVGIISYSRFSWPTLTLLVRSERPCPAVCTLMKALTIALRFLAFPMFVLATALVFKIKARYLGSFSTALFICVCNTIVGAALHELSHAAATVAGGSFIREAGILLFPPGAYVSPNKEPEDKNAALQVFLAGVRCNMVLAGIAAIAGFFSRSWVLQNAALVNLTLGLTNLLPAWVLDGERALSIFLDVPSISGIAGKILKSKTALRSVAAQGGSGYVAIALLSFTWLCNLAIPFFVLGSMLQAVYLIISALI